MHVYTKRPVPRPEDRLAAYTAYDRWAAQEAAKTPSRQEQERLEWLDAWCEYLEGKYALLGIQ